MDRFFVDRISEQNAYIESAEEIKHITKVIRLKEGQSVEIFDGGGKEYIAEIAALQKQQITLNILETVEIERELKTQIVVYQGIPKAQKMDLIIQKLTEIGVQRIVPVKFERCVRLIDEKESKQNERWSKIAFEACKQAKRTKIPSIDYSMDIKELLEDIKKNDHTLLFYENEQQRTIKDMLKNAAGSTLGIIIGPEGGITAKEKEQIEAAGAVSVQIGNRILRTETAAIYGASVVSYELG